MKLSSVFVCQLLIGLAYTEFDLSKGLKDPKEQRQETTVQPKCVGPKCIAPDVVQVAISLRVFTTLLKIITDVGLVDALKKAEAVTVFAPPDEAFAKLPNGTIDSLTAEEAKEIVLRHVVSSKVLSADARPFGLAGLDVQTLGGEVIKVVNFGAYEETGGPILLIVYRGNTIKLDKADVMARNGVIHIINNVILHGLEKDLSKELKDPKEQRLGTTLQPKCVGPKCLGGDVVDVATNAGIFTTLLKMVTNLGLVDTLKEADAVTVFAPPDEAFAKLPAGTIESLTPEQSKEIVLRHVVDSKVLAADVASGPVKLKTLGGEDIRLMRDWGRVRIWYKGNGITIDKTDVMARNGVIHIIDKVILPAATDESTLDAISELLYCSNFWTVLLHCVST